MYVYHPSFVPVLQLTGPNPRGVARPVRCCATDPAPFNAPNRPSARPSAPRHPDPDAQPGPAESEDDAAAPAHKIAGTVVFLSVANEFNLPQLLRRLLRTSARTGVRASSIGSILRLTRAAQGGKLADAFVFAYGSLVVWASRPGDDDCAHFLSVVLEDALQPRAHPVVDTMHFTYGDPRPLRRDLIVLQAAPQPQPQPQQKRKPPWSAASLGADDDNEGGADDDALRPDLERLAVSCALAQSIKLAAFEASMRDTIENTRHLPEQLASTGVISASQRDVSRLMGRLFLDRYRYHLSGDLLVTPAFFWDNEQYLPVYRRVERYLEVRERGDLLNTRVAVVQELYTLLGDEIATQNSMALEFAITAMIAFEILLTLVSLARDSMTSVLMGFSLFFGLTMLAWVLWRLYRRTRFSSSARPPLMQAMGVLDGPVPD